MGDLSVTSPLLTLEEVAEVTRLPLRMLQDGARASRFDHVRMAGRRWMTERQVVQLIEQHTVKAVQPKDEHPDDDAVDELRKRFAQRAARR